MPFKSKKMKQSEIRPALDKLTKMRLTVATTPGVKELFQMINSFINNNKRMDVFIPLVETKQVIRGELEVEPGKQTWIKLEHLS